MTKALGLAFGGLLILCDLTGLGADDIKAGEPPSLLKDSAGVRPAAKTMAGSLLARSAGSQLARDPDIKTAKSLETRPRTPATFVSTPDIAIQNRAVRFNYEATGNGLAYAWDFDEDGKIDSTLQNPAYAFASPGLHKVILHVRDLDAGTTLSMTQAVAVEPSLLRIVDPNPDLIRPDGSLYPNVSEAAALTSFRIGASADGVSKLLLIVCSLDMVRFSLKPDSNGLSVGSLSTFAGPAATPQLAIDIAPVVTNGSVTESLAIAVYTPPASFGDEPGANRTVILELAKSATPNIVAELAQITIGRPPLVLVHGLWSNADVWASYETPLAAAGFGCYPVNYELDNAGSFDPVVFPTPLGIVELRRMIRLATGAYRSGYAVGFPGPLAVAQVDVIGHSMGGLIARGLLQQDDYLQRGNYNLGWVHRLITVGTPHDGTPLAGVLFNNALLSGLFNIKGTRVDDGAVEALTPGSLAYAHLDTSCPGGPPSSALVGDWSPLATGSHDKMQRLVSAAEGRAFDLEVLFGGFSDLIVGRASQTGGLPSENYKELPNHVHSSNVLGVDGVNSIAETASKGVLGELTSLVGTTDLTRFGCFPKPASGSPTLVAQTLRAASRAGSARSASSAMIRITQPVAGSEYRHSPGALVRVEAEQVGGDALHDVIMGIGSAFPQAADGTGPWSASFDIAPETRLGEQTVAVVAHDASGGLVADQIKVRLVPAGALGALRSVPDSLALEISSPPAQLLVQAAFADAPTRWLDVARAALGTTYSVVGGDAVVSVSADGLVSPRAVGADTIEVRYGGGLLAIPVLVVQEKPIPLFFYTLTPCRLIDTRLADSPLGGPALSAGATRRFAVTGQCGVPATAEAISVNVTVTQATAQGDLRIYPADRQPPKSSTLNYGPLRTRANNAVLALDEHRAFGVKCDQPGGSAHLIIDVSGYFE